MLILWSWVLTQEQFRRTLERKVHPEPRRFAWSLGGTPGALEAPPPGAMETDPRAVEAHPGTMEAHLELWD
jgi:hypothetical protein